MRERGSRLPLRATSAASSARKASPQVTQHSISAQYKKLRIAKTAGGLFAVLSGESFQFTRPASITATYFTTHHSPLTTPHSPLTTHHSPLTPLQSLLSKFH